MKAEWAEGGRYSLEDKKVVVLDNPTVPEDPTIPGKQDMGELIVIPPEMQALAEIKSATIAAQEKAEVDPTLGIKDIDSIKAFYMRQHFDGQVDDMVADGSIYEVLKYLDEIGALSSEPEEEAPEEDMSGAAPPREEMLAALMDKISEMPLPLGGIVSEGFEFPKARLADDYEDKPMLMPNSSGFD